MSQGRHDYPGAIHLLRIRGRAGAEIFFAAELLNARDSLEHAADLQVWEFLVARACDRHDARVHGYTWLPNEALLLLQRSSVPLRIILPSLLAGYSRHLHKVGRIPQGGSPYLGRCESIEVAPELLPYSLRHLYARAVTAGLWDSPLRYPFCSAKLHFAGSAPRWFVTQEFLARIRTRGRVSRPSIEQFLGKPESRRHAELFGRLSARVPRIAGESTDIEDSMRRARRSGSTLTVGQIADAVGRLLRKESRSFERVLAVALTTWYATRSGVATLKQMGQWFGRESTTLRADIESHRKSSAVLFELSVEDLLAAIRSTDMADEPPRHATGINVVAPTSIARVRRLPHLRVVQGPTAPPVRQGGLYHVRNMSVGLAPTCSIIKEEDGRRQAESDPEFTVGSGGWKRYQR